MAGPAPVIPDGLTGPEWEYCRPLSSALSEPGFASWVDGLAAVRDVDALLARVARQSSPPGTPPGSAGEQDETRSDVEARARLLETACLHCHVLSQDDDGLHPGPGAALWTSHDPRTRTWFRAFLLAAAAEVVVRSLPGRSYHGEQTSSLLAEVVAAAASAQPWTASQLEARGGPFGSLLLLPEVHRGLDRLRWLGVLDAGASLEAHGHAKALLETLAGALDEPRVPEPRHPDSRVTGPTYEVEASVDVAGERRVRLVRISGSSRVSVLTDLVMTVFGLRHEGRIGLRSGVPLPSSLGEAGLLTAAGADPDDPWMLAVGDVACLEDPEEANAVVSAWRVSVRSLVEHLGERWELPLRTSAGAVVEDPVLHLRVVRTVSADDSRALVFPSCLAGTGAHLARAGVEAAGDDDDLDDDGLDDDRLDDDRAGGAPFDLDAVEAQVARLHRGRR
ncbi:hypothetical protein [Quadrisphaera sp. KR29]|uniref:hypothetical protein n=1 Tax=Quadrisphaera sp. KR29 TaxID=3461391 RepID=UPI004043D159